MTLVVNSGIALLMVALAWWVVSAREAFLSIVGFIAYGLLLGLVWVRLSGIDVALTEAAIGGGLTGALLIGAVSRLRGTEKQTQAEPVGAATRALALLISVGVTAALALAVLTLPDPAPTLAAEVAADIGSTGVKNPITAVLLAFRALDTLLEAIVLVIALIGVWSLGPDAAWGGRPGQRQPGDPNGIFAYLARLLPPVGVVIATYIFWAGADHPGGKFQGATILAAMWMLVLMAGLADTPPISGRWLRLGIVIGPLVFIAIGWAGVQLAGAFLSYPVDMAKPMIVAVELALMPTLTLVLGLLLAGAPARANSEGAPARNNSEGAPARNNSEGAPARAGHPP
jgi:multisubunit Na+/H+ antiporter MnhB subunit